MIARVCVSVCVGVYVYACLTLNSYSNAGCKAIGNASNAAAGKDRTSDLHA